MFVHGINESIPLLLIHISLAFVSCLSLFLYRNRPYSLFKIVHLFLLFFMCIAPFFQYKNDIVLWGGKGFTESDYIYTSIVLLIIVLLYNSVYYFIDKYSKCKFTNYISKNISSSIVINKSLRKREFYLFCLISIFIFLTVAYACNFNLFYLFLRGGVSEEDTQIIDAFEANIPQSISLIIVNFLKPMSVVLFLAAYKLKANKIQVVILGLLMLLCAFPTSMPRFSADAMDIPVLLTFSNFFKKTNVFVFVFVFGLLVMFPFLNNFRYFTSDKEIEFGLNFDMFLEGHFDAYSSFLRVLVNDVVTYGYQLLGCILFWLPRSMWVSKPIGSGAFLCEELNLNYSNISCCYFAEGYINGGHMGLIFFTIILAIYSATFDKTYWRLKENRKNNIFFEILYFLLLGLTFFILRGDLLSAFAFTMGFCCTVYSIYYLLFFLRKYSFRILKRKQ